VRRTNVLRDMGCTKKIEIDDEKEKKVKLNINKTLNVPDDVLKRQMEMEKHETEEAARDKSKEEF